MRGTGRLLATINESSAGNPLIRGRSAPMALLPPIPLYRRLLRSHRKKLPAEERLMGDMYIKSEFRAHRNVENPMHIVGFLTEWQMYAQIIEGDTWKGEKIDKAKVDKMSDQQIGQLYELMQIIQKQSRDGDDGSGDEGAK